MSETTPPSRTAAALAASLPLLFPLLACCTLPLAGRGDYDGAERMLQEMGVWLYVLLAAGGFSAAVGAVLVYLSSRGLRVPVAVTLFVGALPWLVGLAGTSYSLSVVSEAVAYADPASRAMLLAAGISEASTARLFGGWLAGSLLSAVGLGLAVGAIGLRAPSRKNVGALLGGLSALPLLGLAAWVTMTLGLGGLLLLVPAVGALVIAAVAAAAPGTDEPHRRSGALAAGAALAAGLAFVATSAAVHTGGMIQIFMALAHAREASGELLAAAAEDLLPARLVSTWGVPVALIPAVVVAGWAAVRSGASGGRIAGAIAALLVAAMLPASDALVLRSSANTFAAVGTTATPWEDVPGFEPVVPMGRGGEPTAADLVAAMEQVHLAAGSTVDWRDQPALTEAIRSSLAGAVRRDDVFGGAMGGRAFPRVVVAVDARLPAERIRTLAHAATEAGARSLVVVGTSASGPTEEQRARIRQNAPMMPVLSDSLGAVSFLLEPGLGGSDAGVAHVAVGPEATAESLVDEAAAALARGQEPLLVTGALPARPAGGLGADAAPAGILGVLRGAGEEAEVGGSGDPAVRGSLDRNVIRRVIRRHVNEVRYCYERELARDPSLAGRVTVRFVVSPAGSVTSAEATESTLGSTAAESCIAGAVRRWRFPEPEGGGVVVVNYPFVFNPA